MLSAKMRKAIFQNSIPYDWQKVKKLPGVMPLNPHEWIIFDDAYSDQMAEREDLLKNNNDVIVLDNNSQAVARELLTILLQFLRKADDFEVSEKLAFNQGIYNAFLAVGLLWTFFISSNQWAYNIALFFLSFIISSEFNSSK